MSFLKKCSVAVFLILIMAGCTTPPSISDQMTDSYLDEVEQILQESLAFDPYGNTVYWKDKADKQKISVKYEPFIQYLNQNVPGAKNAYGGYQSAADLKTKYLYANNILVLANTVKNRFHMSDTAARAVADEFIRDKFFTILMNGHAVENGDLAVYEVPILFVCYVEWTNSVQATFRVITREFTLKAKSSKADVKAEAKAEATADSGKADIKERLKNLEDLFKSGLINEEEYRQKKAEILADL
ncbi:MAG: SHOCT domain-containing protein [Spirochaetales bacterium]|nr:SHOCT domain-containing protein [Spirochaetales bacterium]